MTAQIQRMCQELQTLREEAATRQQVESIVEALRADLASSLEAQQEMERGVSAMTQQLHSLQAVLQEFAAWWEIDVPTWI